MLGKRPTLDLKDNLSEIEKAVQENGHIVLTKNGHASMVVLSFEEYSRLVNNLDSELDEADRLANEDPARLSHEEVFLGLRK